MSLQNEQAKEIQAIVERLINLRDTFRGERILICGYCYHDDAPTWEEHHRKSPHCNRNAWPCALAIYDDEWFKDNEGRWVSL